MPIAILEERLESRVLNEPLASSAEGFLSWFTPWALVLVGFAVRLSFLLLLKTYRFDRVDDFCISGETTNIAASIARGHGFHSAFNDVDTGPTAWLAPAYPFFVAAVFRLFGILTRASIVSIFTVQSLLSALTVVPILGIAKSTVGKRAGLWAAWTWCLFPWFSKWSVTWLWDTSLSALLLALLFWYSLRFAVAPSRRSSIGFGALWGLTLLVNPALASFLPVSLAWCCFELRGGKRRWLKPALTCLFTCLVVISPWLVRNRSVFGHWVFLRGNFGFEFALGNYHGSLGRGWGGSHPSGNQTEFKKYWRIGEYEYVREREQQALHFVRESPREFATLTGERVVYFWDGSSMDYLTAIPWYWAPGSYFVFSLLLLPALLVAHRRNLRAWQMFFGALLLYPIPYYLTFSQARYRHAIEPLMLLLIAYAGADAAGKIGSFFQKSAAKNPL